MESSPSFLTLVISLIMIAIIVDGRVNPGEYMRDSLVFESPLAMKKTHCHNLAEAKNSFNKELEPRPNVSVYDNGTGLKGMKKTDKEFEPRPNVSIYDNGMNLKGKKTSNDDKGFDEPRPNVSIYKNDMSLKGKKTYVAGDFEPRPNVSVYDKDENLKGTKMSQSDFEPRPNVSVYDNGVGLKDKNTQLEGEFEPRPNVSIYVG